LRPLPYADPARVVFLWDSSPDRPVTNLTPGRFLDFTTRLNALDDLAAVGHLSVTLTGTGLPERLSGASVSSNFFDMLGVEPLAGRVFHAGERDRLQVVLSEGLWRQRFGADPTLVGRAVVLDGRPWTVAGVMPASFYWPAITAQPSRATAPELWLLAPDNELPGMPVAYQGDLRQNRTIGYLRAVGRIAAGSNVETARAEIGAISRQLQQEHPDTDGDRQAILFTAREQLLGHVRMPVFLLLGAATLLLAASCANVANLQLMRLTERSRELRIQAALGASPASLAAQLLAEAAIVGGAAALVGGALGAGTLKALRAFAAIDVPRLGAVRLDSEVFVSACVVALAGSALVALLPLLRLRRDSAITSGERASTTRVSTRSRRWLVGAEVATAVALACGAILFGESLARVERVDIGIAGVDRLLTFDVVLAGAGRSATPSQSLQFFEQVLERVRALPGVSHASAAATLPVGGDDFGTSVIAEHSRRIGSQAEPLPVGYQAVGSDWFETLGVRLLQGRAFSAADGPGRPPVLIVNRALAETLWPGQDPLGRRLRTDADGPWMSVVGVVADLRHLGPRHPPRPEIYQPLSQRSFSFAAFAVRVNGDPYALVEPTRREVAALDPGQPISNVKTMGEHLRRAQAESRALSWLTALFGMLAMVVAALGIYGAIGFSVAQRTREFGVRLALGASPRQVGCAVVGETLLTTSGGLGVGLLFAAAGSRALQSLLFDAPPVQATAYAGSTLLLAAIALLSGLAPARRAMRANPASVLRSE
jgi:predicted permease